MSITNLKKNQKNEKTSAHVCLMSYSNEKKNINMVYIHLHENGFTQMWNLEQTSMDFKVESMVSSDFNVFENIKLWTPHHSFILEGLR